MKARAGKRVVPSALIEREYRRELDALVDAMCDAVEYAVKVQRLGKTRDGVSRVFRTDGAKVAVDFAQKAAAHSVASFTRASNGLRDRRPNNPNWTKYADENVRLVESIPVQYLKKVDLAIHAYNVGTVNAKSFARRMEELRTITHNRVKLIAHDQSNKVTEGVMLECCASSGVRLVKWCHSPLSAKPREYHLRKWDGHSGVKNGKPNGLNGYIFDIGFPPVIDLKTGERGYPSQLINCKCYLVPVAED